MEAEVLPLGPALTGSWTDSECLQVKGYVNPPGYRDEIRSSWNTQYKQINPWKPWEHKSATESNCVCIPLQWEKGQKKKMKTPASKGNGRQGWSRTEVNTGNKDLGEQTFAFCKQLTATRHSLTNHHTQIRIYCIGQVASTGYWLSKENNSQSSLPRHQLIILCSYSALCQVVVRPFKSVRLLQ